MDLKEKMDDFYKRWNIISEDDYHNAFLKFKQRILNIFHDIDNHISPESIASFCQYYGIKEIWNHNTFGTGKWSYNIINKLERETDEKKFYELIELIFSLDIYSSYERGNINDYSRNKLFEKVMQAIDLSEVNVSIKMIGDRIIFCPKGEKLLDEELVNSPLLFLNKESEEHFIQALQDYQSRNYVKSAESLRRSSEEFLRYKLNNHKGLDANILELQQKIKIDGGDAQIRNIIGSVFKYLDQYFNDNSKHNDGNINDIENEFLIYQIGLLLRYINFLIKI